MVGRVMLKELLTNLISFTKIKKRVLVLVDTDLQQRAASKNCKLCKIRPNYHGNGRLETCMNFA